MFVLVIILADIISLIYIEIICLRNIPKGLNSHYTITVITYLFRYHISIGINHLDFLTFNEINQIPCTYIYEKDY